MGYVEQHFFRTGHRQLLTGVRYAHPTHGAVKLLAEPPAFGLYWAELDSGVRCLVNAANVGFQISCEKVDSAEVANKNDLTERDEEALALYCESLKGGTGAGNAHFFINSIRYVDMGLLKLHEGGKVEPSQILLRLYRAGALNRITPKMKASA